MCCQINPALILSQMYAGAQKQECKDWTMTFSLCEHHSLNLLGAAFSDVTITEQQEREKEHYACLEANCGDHHVVQLSGLNLSSLSGEFP